MKKGFNILLILCAAFAIMSCNKTPTFADRLKSQTKAIDRLIDQEGIVVLKDYPKNGVFEENQFVKLKNGVYLNIIDSGNGNRAVFDKTVVLCRFKGRYLYTSNDTVIWRDILTQANNSYPMEFKYGQYIPNTEDELDFLSPGLGTALEYVGDSSYVKLIVPFNNVGSSSQSSNYLPIYYEKVRFIFK